MGKDFLVLCREFLFYISGPHVFLIVTEQTQKEMSGYAASKKVGWKFKHSHENYQFVMKKHLANVCMLAINRKAAL